MSDRDLDAAVGKILGWECVNPKVGRCDETRLVRCGGCGGAGHGNCYGFGRGPVQIECCTDLPGYSTDPEQVGAMLEWAAAQGYSVSLMNYAADDLYPNVDRWQATMTKRGRPLGPTDAMMSGDVTRMGATPQLALARAIVAAADAGGAGE